MFDTQFTDKPLKLTRNAQNEHSICVISFQMEYWVCGASMNPKFGHLDQKLEFSNHVLFRLEANTKVNCRNMSKFMK